MARRNGKAAVLVVTTPKDWRPSSHHTLPTAVESAEFYIRRVSLSKACAIADAYNRDAYRRFSGRWALVVAARPVGPIQAGSLA